MEYIDKNKWTTTAHINTAQAQKIMLKLWAREEYTEYDSLHIKTKWNYCVLFKDV